MSKSFLFGAYFPFSHNMSTLSNTFLGGKSCTPKKVHLVFLTNSGSYFKKMKMLTKFGKFAVYRVSQKFVPLLYKSVFQYD